MFEIVIKNNYIYLLYYDKFIKNAHILNYIILIAH